MGRIEKETNALIAHNDHIHYRHKSHTTYLPNA